MNLNVLRENINNFKDIYGDYITHFDKSILPIEESLHSIESISNEISELKAKIINWRCENNCPSCAHDEPTDKVLTNLEESDNKENQQAPSSITPSAEEKENDQVVDKLRVVLPLTEKDFKSIPKYMLGRFTIENINEIIDKMDEFLISKNQIQSKPLKHQSKEEREQCIKWKEIENKANKLSSNLFCLESDIKPLLKDKLRPLFAKAIPCLRHCRRIREERHGKNTFYFPIIM